MRNIDLNCDMGESYGRFKIGNDEAIMPLISSCNIACGFHGGDPTTIRKTIQMAIYHKVKIGAHPSYPDLAGFGRRKMVIPRIDLFNHLLYQISAIKGMVECEGGKLHHVKPHGALYNDMAKDAQLANIVLEAVSKFDQDIITYGLAGKIWVNLARNFDMPYKEEGFSDRAYKNNLFLVSRGKPNAIIKTVEERIEQASNMILNNEVKTESGDLRPIEVDTICIHGDDPLALETASSIRNIIG